MNWGKTIVIVLVIALAAVVGYLLYFYLVPHKGLSEESRQTKAEVAELRESLKTMEEAKADLTQRTVQVGTLEREVEKLRATLSELEGENVTVSTEADRLRMALEQSGADLSKLSGEMENLKGVYTQKVQSLEDQLAEKNLHIQEVESQSNLLRQTLVSLEADTNALNQEMSDLRSRLNESTGQLQELAQEVVNREKTIEGMRQTHQVRIDELNKDLDKSASRIADLETEIKSLKAGDLQKVQVLGDQLVQRDQELRDLRDESEQLQQAVSSLQSGRESLRHKAAELERQLGESRGQTGELSRKVAAQTEKLGKMEEARQRLVKRVEELEEEKESLGLETSELKSSLQECRIRFQEVSQGVTVRDDQLEKIRRTHQELVEQLKRQIQQRELEISALQETLSIRFLDKILFEPGNAVITSTGRGALKNVGKELKKLSDVQISVEGHTDDQPLSEASRAVYHDNLGLSVARAAAVARTLRTMGVDPNRLSVAGYSMYRPVVTNNTAEGLEQNRRVEIILAPIR